MRSLGSNYSLLGSVEFLFLDTCKILVQKPDFPLMMETMDDLRFSSISRKEDAARHFNQEYHYEWTRDVVLTGYRREPKQLTTLGKTQGKVCECVEVTLSISKLFYGPHGIILNSRSHRDDVAVEQSL